MNKWYQSKGCKGLLVLTAHILVVFIMVSMVLVTVAAGGRYLNPFTHIPKHFEDTEKFAENLYGEISSALYGRSHKENFETDGVYNPEKIVDVVRYAKEDVIDGESSSGLSYRLGDLALWSGIYTEEELEIPTLAVCKKTDGTYYYYTMEEFQMLFDTGELSFIVDVEENGRDSDDIFYELENGYFYDKRGSGVSVPIKDKNNQVLYTDCWTGGFFIEEIADCKPQEAESLVSLFNTNMELNGRMSEYAGYLNDVIRRLYGQLESYENLGEEHQQGNTNLSYMFVNDETKEVYTNVPECAAYENVESNIAQFQKKGKYVIVGTQKKDFSSNIKEAKIEDWYHLAKQISGNYRMAVAIDTDYPIQDTFSEYRNNYGKAVAGVADSTMFVWVAMAALFVILVWLTMIAGRTKEQDELKLCFFDRWKTEIAATVIGIGVMSGMGIVCVSIDHIWRRIYAVNDGWYYQQQVGDVNPEGLFLAGVGAAFTFAFALAGYLSLIRRLKAGNLWRNSISYLFVQTLKAFWRHRKATTKTVLAYVGFLFIHLLMMTGDGKIVFLGIGVDVAAFIYLVREAIGKQKVKEGLNRIGGGELNYQISENGLRGDYLEITRKLNNIGEGLNAAVEESMKNERLKTDLITNVSHDIKTPLTSIINYVDLLKREDFEDPKIQNYLNILESKAQRLKTLTEDVVEASKISSGNIKLEFMNLNLVEMINQTNGEFSEKFENRNLNVVMNLPETPVLVYADGRRMWRVLENLFGNAAKYAMEGTRIYADLEVKGNRVYFSLKNISEQPLNILADELTERFIRGDVSRSTEGSGLGLSIAKSLVERQNGTLDLYLDGDLFKATISFDLARPKAGEESNS